MLKTFARTISAISRQRSRHGRRQLSHSKVNSAHTDVHNHSHSYTYKTLAWLTTFGPHLCKIYVYCRNATYNTHTYPPNSQNECLALATRWRLSSKAVIYDRYKLRNRKEIYQITTKKLWKYIIIHFRAKKMFWKNTHFQHFCDFQSLAGASRSAL